MRFIASVLVRRIHVMHIRLKQLDLDFTDSGHLQEEIDDL